MISPIRMITFRGNLNPNEGVSGINKDITGVTPQITPNEDVFIGGNAASKVDDIREPEDSRDKLPWYLYREGNRILALKDGCTKPVLPSNEELRAIYTNSFIEWAKETDFIRNGLKESLKPENCLGQGFDHAAYSINGNDDYVLRIKRDYYTKTQDIDYSQYTLRDTRDMELIGNYGQEVAILEDNVSDPWKMHPQIEVLKKQEGFPNGNCSPRALYHADGSLREGVIAYEDPIRKDHYEKCLETLANFPDRSYDDLIQDLLNSGEAGYRFDALNSNNFLIDPVAQRINLIDMSKTVKPHKDRFGDTLYALVNQEFYGEYSSSYTEGARTMDQKIQAIQNTETILKKYTAAMIRNKQKFNINNMQFNELLRGIASSFWLQTNDYQEKLQKLRDMDVLYEGSEVSV